MEKEQGKLIFIVSVVFADGAPSEQNEQDASGEKNGQ